MKPILYIKGSLFNDVRLQKFFKFFKSKNIDVYFWGWNRTKKKDKEHSNVSYLLSGGGHGGNLLFLYYPLWMFVVFVKLLFAKKISRYNIIAINFECGLPIYCVSKIRSISYVYEIYDEFAISHNFPIWLQKIISMFDHKVMDNAKFVIHVDKNRLTYDKCKSIIIENTPYDFYNGKKRDYNSLTHKFAIIGLLSKTRGLEQIYLFARSHPNISFILAGTFYDSTCKKEIQALPNVVSYEKMPQTELFSKLTDCCGIFSLYDPQIKINTLAASNKVYDAMMLGIPVITNPEVVNSSFILKNEIGVVVNYNYDETWTELGSDDFVSTAKYLGSKGRKLYISKYLFDNLVENKLLPLLE